MKRDSIFSLHSRPRLPPSNISPSRAKPAGMCSTKCKVVVSGTHRRLSYHAAKQTFPFLIVFSAPGRGKQSSHLEPPIHPGPDVDILLSRSRQTNVYWFPSPRTTSQWTSRNGIFITCLAFSSQYFQWTRASSRRGGDGTKQRTLQLMYDNYIYFSLETKHPEKQQQQGEAKVKTWRCKFSEN